MTANYMDVERLVAWNLDHGLPWLRVGQVCYVEHKGIQRKAAVVAVIDADPGRKQDRALLELQLRQTSLLQLVERVGGRLRLTTTSYRKLRPRWLQAVRDQYEARFGPWLGLSRTDGPVTTAALLGLPEGGPPPGALVPPLVYQEGAQEAAGAAPSAGTLLGRAMAAAGQAPLPGAQDDDEGDPEVGYLTAGELERMLEEVEEGNQVTIADRWDHDVVLELEVTEHRGAGETQATYGAVLRSLGLFVSSEHGRHGTAEDAVREAILEAVHQLRFPERERVEVVELREGVSDAR